MVQAACYVVCAYLSGMRDSELQELRRGCHFVERSADGVVDRHKLRGRAFKGQGAQGRQATWVVIDPVAKAVDILEAMHSHDHLLTSPGKHGYPVAARRSGDLTGGARLGPSIIRILNEFRDHVNETQTRDGVAAIPDHDGRPWHFTTAQFRRTLAWHIANQPFGTVAGMLQYQHVSVATFEGYVGESASGFRREVETDRRLAALDDLVDDYRDHVAGLPSAGGGAAKRNAVFAHVHDSLDSSAVVDDARLRAMLKHSARTLYPGVLNDCFFERDAALCLRTTGQGGNEPLLPLCQPEPVRQLGDYRPTTRPSWDLAIGEVQVHLTQKDLSTIQRQALKGKLSEMEAAIAPLKDL